MRKDLKIGLLVGMILVIVIVMMVSLWPGQGVAERQQKMFQESVDNSPIEIDRNGDEESGVREKPIVKGPFPPPVESQVRIHTVSRGETLTSIAINYYGSAEYIKTIIDANRTVLSDPDKIRTGMRLVIPSR